MIHDFLDIAPYVRSITYNGRNSLEDFGLLVENSTEDPTDEPETKYVDVPFMNGYYDFTELDGEIHYPNKQWAYAFVVVGDNDAEIKERIAEVREWLSEYGDGDLYDSDYEQWKYVQARYTGSSFNMQKIGSLVKCVMRVGFTAYPYMRSRSGQETNCCDITPDASPAYYLFNEYTSGGVEYYYLSRMKRANSSAPLSSTITYDEVTLPGPKLGAYPHITIAAATAPAYYMMPPKSTNGTSIRVDVSTLTGGSIVSGGIEGYTYLKQNAGEALSFRIYGYDPTTLGDSTSRSNCTMHIKEAAWYYPAGSGTVRFRRDLIPNTDRMQILSEAEPVVRLNPPYYGTVDPVDINDFALAEYDLIRIESAENELCRLRYNSVTYRR